MIEQYLQDEYGDQAETILGLMQDRDYPLDGDPERLVARLLFDLGRENQRQESMQEGPGSWFSKCPRDEYGRCASDGSPGRTEQPLTKDVADAPEEIKQGIQKARGLQQGRNPATRAMGRANELLLRAMHRTGTTRDTTDMKQWDRNNAEYEKLRIAAKSAARGRQPLPGDDVADADDETKAEITDARRRQQSRNPITRKLGRDDEQLARSAHGLKKDIASLRSEIGDYWARGRKK